jgi:ActR/RegA family two-component response regulator
MSLDTATNHTSETVDATLATAPPTPASAEPVARLDADLPSLAILQRRYIDRVLERTGRNKTRAARMLGIDRRTLNRMLARERAKKASVTA